ncbi:hypothetical protein [Paraburkholderia ginsengisoli]|uniref:DUF4148 domain-containing protein n=1 Tax=Paraburkholderia ginsengisoli TaxID=311231 RepID=A0A7T4N720_9BURK|nr:hypothetical protein [Paraburkholderia ginsengisoli]QQC66442.1 hypothetical protein I6I06_27135 [Paraburkholderia ginsengisoli]
MIKHLVVAALLSASAAIVSPAFAASGYGPAPHYDPLAGAPASQRGQSALTVRSEQAQAIANADTSAQSYGGARDTSSQSGARVASYAPLSTYSHH